MKRSEINRLMVDNQALPGITGRVCALRPPGASLSGRVSAYGRAVSLGPGESITIPPRLYHEFYTQQGEGRVLVGEVSSVNDDNTDNRFLEPVSRFPEIEEDEEPYRLLCNEYPPSV